jgi:hypothetical protein
MTILEQVTEIVKLAKELEEDIKLTPKEYFTKYLITNESNL